MHFFHPHDVCVTCGRPWRPMGFRPWSIPATLELSDGRSVSLDLMVDLIKEIAVKGGAYATLTDGKAIVAEKMIAA